ncbi:hypothetical protein ABEV55_14665 [Aneurinibacillus thermoaerophilus]|uniref:hypothetical protein n=1 Tax=Aneurinibacillus thermoaerophilus TaxID=143495 RepID=UPI002E1C4C05|nr:hypothetical protein [Aneurinibacillus thermoaerophilus]
MDVIAIFIGGMVAAYFITGFIINFLLFLWAKMKAQDRWVPEWDMVLNSFWGLLYFLFIGSIFWFYAAYRFVLKQGNEEQIEQRDVKENHTLFYKLRHPYLTYKRWFYEYYE